MQIALVSDLHLEFPGQEPVALPTADVLVCAGDILLAKDMSGPGFLEEVTRHYAHVVYVAGNHEFYRGRLLGTLETLRTHCNKYKNLHFLDDEWVDVGDVRFLGGTLWTDCDKGCPVTAQYLQQNMNDYRLITDDQHGYTKLRAAATARLHAATKSFIVNNLTDNTVVVTHHAPSMLSIAERFRDNQYVNAGYASDLSELILDNPQIKLWCHGHMHTASDYYMGSTRVVCNPRGYPGEVPGYQVSVYTV